MRRVLSPFPWFFNSEILFGKNIDEAKNAELPRKKGQETGQEQLPPPFQYMLHVWFGILASAKYKTL